MTSQRLQVERIGSGDDRFADAKRWEYEIFGRQNHFTSATDDEAGEMCQYRRWEACSEFYAGFADPAPGAAPVAILRALRWNPELGMDSFSTVADARVFQCEDGLQNMLYPHWAEFFTESPPSSFAELATQAVSKPHRYSGVMAQVWEAFFAELAADGVRYVTVALVVPLFDFYRALIGEAITQIGRVLPDYVGADSVPALVDLSRLVPVSKP